VAARGHIRCTERRDLWIRVLLRRGNIVVSNSRSCDSAFSCSTPYAFLEDPAGTQRFCAKKLGGIVQTLGRIAGPWGCGGHGDCASNQFCVDNECKPADACEWL